MYKFEIHLHTSACSKCGRSTAEEMVDAAKAHGYSGFVLTNHFFYGNTCVDRELSWAEFVGAFAEEYHRAAEYGKQQGIRVSFGLEEVYKAGKEMLIYGVSPETLMVCREWKDMTPEEIRDFVHANGGVVICAHPFRDRPYIPNPDEIPDVALFDGIETYNYANQPQENEKAYALATDHHMVMVSGGDVHHIKNFGNSGIAFEEPVESEAQFLRLLKSGQFKLISYSAHTSSATLP